MTFVNRQNVSRDEYAVVIDEIAKKKICPFCPEHIEVIHPHPITEHDHWLVTDNAYPYEPSRVHILLVHRLHIEHVTEITPAAWLEFQVIIKSLALERGLIGGSLVMRFGDTSFTGASVSHLHAHLFQSDPSNEKYNQKTGVTCRIG